MDQFFNLAERIQSRLESSEKFSDICTDELSKFEFDLSLPEFEANIAKWMLNSPLPKQLNVYNSFGQPPVTLFNNGKFVVDIYFWMHHDTSVHDHSFSGAFKVLFGRSLHEEFSIESLQDYAPDVKKTRLEQKSLDLFVPNHVQKIEKGNGFTHRLIHLDQPTVTLCVRTINDQAKEQWHHFPNGLSILKKSNSEETIKQLFYCEYLYQQNMNKGQEFIKSLVKQLEYSVTMNLYEQLSFDGFGLSAEVIQAFFEEVTQEYSQYEWFEIYEQFYKTMQERYVQFEDDSPGFRVIEHAHNTGLCSNKTKEILNQVYPGSIPEQYLEIINELMD